MTNTVDPDQMAKNAVSEQSLHCFPIIQQFDKKLNGVAKLRPVCVKSYGILIFRGNK